MSQTSGQVPAANDNVKKRVEPVPGQMATRQTLKAIRTSTIPKGHKPKR